MLPVLDSRAPPALQRLTCSNGFLSTDVNVAFQQAAHKVFLDDDNLLPLLHLTVDHQGKDSKGSLLRH